MCPCVCLFVCLFVRSLVCVFESVCLCFDACVFDCPQDRAPAEFEHLLVACMYLCVVVVCQFVCACLCFFVCLFDCVCVWLLVCVWVYVCV